MTETRHVINALPLVAEALGRKFNVKVRIGGQRAYTNGRDIHIPALPLDADETVLRLARGYLDHEAAHLRITDFNALKEAQLTDTEKHVCNILEDYMVERRLAEIYPGCLENFSWLIRHLFLKESDTQDTKDHSPANTVFNWLLISLRALTVPELMKEKARLATALDRDFPGLREKLEPLVDTVPGVCVHTQACISMAKTLVAVLESYVKANASKKEENREAGNQPARENHTDKTADGKGDCQDKPSGPASTKEANPAEEDVGSEGDVRDDPVEALREALENPSSLEEQDAGRLAGKLLEEAGKVDSCSRLSVAVALPFGGSSLSAAEIAGIRRTTAALRTRLSALLQTQVLTGKCPGRRGRIDTRRIARLAVCEMGIFMRHALKQGISTAVHILLDASFSMQSRDRITLASHACYAVADALQNIPGVGVAVTVFPNGWCPHEEGNLRLATVATVLAHKQKLHPRFRIHCNGSTPMAEALWWVAQQMSLLHEQRKLLLILSDGEPDDLGETLNALRVCRMQGIEVCGLGIQTTAMQQLLPGKQARAIYDLNDLAPAMFDLLRAKLLKTPGGRNEDAA